MPSHSHTRLLHTMTLSPATFTRQNQERPGKLILDLRPTQEATSTVLVTLPSPILANYKEAPPPLPSESFCSLPSLLCLERVPLSRPRKRSSTLSPQLNSQLPPRVFVVAARSAACQHDALLHPRTLLSSTPLLELAGMLTVAPIAGLRLAHVRDASVHAAHHAVALHLQAQAVYVRPLRAPSSSRAMLHY